MGSGNSRTGLFIYVIITIMLFSPACAPPEKDTLDVRSRRDLVSIRYETTRLPLTDLSDPVFGGGLAETSRLGNWSLGWETDFYPVFIYPGDRLMTLRAYWNRNGHNSLQIHVYVNDHPVEVIDVAPDTHDYRILLSARYLKKGLNHIRLRYSHVFRPSEVFTGSTDDRELAVKYQEILFSMPGSSNDPADYPIRRDSGGVTGGGDTVSVPAMIELELEPGIFSELILGVRTETVPSLPLRLDAFLNNEPLGSIAAMKAFPNTWALGLPLDTAEPMLYRFFLEPQEFSMSKMACSLEEFRLIRARPAPSSAPNLILITLDTLRQDMMGAYGDPTIKTPFLDEFSRHSRQFASGYSHIPITGPAHSSIFTGKYPHSIPVLANVHVLPDQPWSLPRILKRRGYQTAAAVSAGVLNRRFGYHQGFSYFSECHERRGFSSAGETNHRIRTLIDTLDESFPFFLWCHYYDPHMPYSPPGIRGNLLKIEESNGQTRTVNIADGRIHTIPITLRPGSNPLVFKSDDHGGFHFQIMELDSSECRLDRGHGWKTQTTTFWGKTMHAADSATLTIDNPSTEFRTVNLKLLGYDDPSLDTLRERYRGEIEYLDRELMNLFVLLNDRNMMQNSVVIITGDHGESFGEHGMIGHIHQLYDPMIRVPFWLSLPVPADCNTHLGAIARHIDILPTIGRFMGVERIPDLPGSDLMGRNTDAAEVFCETFKLEARETIFSCRHDGFHLLFFPDRQEKWELFDQNLDPGELINLHETVPGEERLRLRLQKWMPSVDVEPVQGELSPETESVLKALGYL